MAFIKKDLVTNHQVPLVFTIIRMLAMIIEVFLHCEQSSVQLEWCCTIPLVAAACVCQTCFVIGCLVLTPKQLVLQYN